jgi:hypothetical protein
MTNEDDKYVFKSARFRRDRDVDAQVLDIIDYYEKQRPKKVSFKDLVTDAILRYQGIDPVVFQKDEYPHQKPATVDEIRELLEQMPQSSGITLEDVQRLLETFADEIIRHLKKSGGRSRDTIEDDDDGETVSAFAKNFARGFMQRQRQGVGDDDE